MALDEVIIGIDIGANSIHSAVVTRDRQLKEFFSSLHFGNPWNSLLDIIKRLYSSYSPKGVAFTGIGGELPAKANDTFFEYDTITIPAGAQFLDPKVRYLFHLGARDPYFFELDPEIGKLAEETGTKCGGGSGILLAKQYKRYFAKLFPLTSASPSQEEMQQQMDAIFNHSAEQVELSQLDLEIGGRCGVIITSDMIHKQNAGYHISDILKAMEKRIAMNYVSDVVRSRDFESGLSAMFTGGVAANQHIVSEVASLLGLNIRVPEQHACVGAIGAALLSLENLKQLSHVSNKNILDLAKKRREKVTYGPKLSLENVAIYEEQPLKKPEGKVDVIIGVDGGSTTSKVVVIDANTKEMYYKKYISTSGDPENAGKTLLRCIREEIGDKIQAIAGVGFTGSSAGLYEILFTDITKTQRADMVMDEITCHKLGVRHYNQNVDTIFELGGQDAKFTRLRPDGLVDTAKMNLACFAGTGQTLENMALGMGMDVKTTLQDAAFKARQIPHIDTTCAVFSEAGIADLVAMKLPKEEIAAAALYATIGGYVHKFVGNENIGEYCSAQGGPFRGKAELAMLSQQTGKKIYAFPHREVMGAVGAALAVKRRIQKDKEKGIVRETAFRGFGVIDMNFSRKKTPCSNIHGEDKCKARDCSVDVYEIGSDKVYAGGACPKGNTDSSGSSRSIDYTKKYLLLLEQELKRFTIPLQEHSDRPVVGIPRSMFFLNENAIFLAAFYHAMGFDVKVSPETNDEIVALGFKHSHSENCFPVKIAHGHAALLLESDIDKMLLVNYIGSKCGSHSTPSRMKTCPYSASIGFNIAAKLNIDRDSLLMPVLHVNDSHRSLEERLFEDLRRVFGTSISMPDVEDAVAYASEEQENFQQRIFSEGKSFLAGLEKEDKHGYVGIGRGYTMLDTRACADTGSLFSQKGLTFIPSYFFNNSDINISEIAQNIYWQLGKRIVQDAIFVAEHPKLYPVYMTNYACGPDSFLMYHINKIFKHADKPVLVLQTDGHTSNAQYGTRILAYNEVVKERRGQ